MRRWCVCTTILVVKSSIHKNESGDIIHCETAPWCADIELSVGYSSCGEFVHVAHSRNSVEEVLPCYRLIKIETEFFASWLVDIACVLAVQSKGNCGRAARAVILANFAGVPDAPIMRLVYPERYEHLPGIDHLGGL